MQKKETHAPKNWGNDHLTKYLDNFRNNQFATFDNKKEIVADIIKIDELFNRFLKDAKNPKPLLPFQFFQRAYYAYKASAGAAMAGQCYESMALLRLCLEQSSYGFYINDNEDRWERWMNRHENVEAKKKVRSEFTHSKIKKHIKESSKNIHDLYEKLYETTIDYGAHPNERGFSISTEIKENNEEDIITTICLQKDGIPLDFSLSITIKIGLISLHLAQLIYPEKFELLGIRHELEIFRKRYQTFFKSNAQY